MNKNKSSMRLDDYEVNKEIDCLLKRQTAFLENISDVVAIMDKDGIIQYKSPNIKHLFGWDPQDLVGKSGWHTVHPDDRDRLGGIFNDVLNTANSIAQAEYKYMHKNGNYIPVRLTAKNLLHVPYVNGVLLNYHDISERKKMEDALEKERLQLSHSEAKFKAAFYTSPDSVNINKLNGEYIEINEGFTKLTGYTEEDCLGKLSSEINIWTIPEDREKLISGLKKDGIVENLESIFCTKDGKHIPALMSAQIIYINNEPHILSVTRSIAQRKKNELALIKAKEKAEESDNLKTEFIHNMSHEIRTPLNGIMGFSKLLQKPKLSDDERTTFTTIISQCGEDLLKVVESVLEISTLATNQEKLKESKFNLHQLLQSIFDSYDIKAKEKELNLYFKQSPLDNEEAIVTDKNKLNKVLENLLDNAIKYTQKGSIEFGYNTINENIEIYVKDTGIGISPENFEKIFDRFSQEDKELSKTTGGLGLGLSIAKENATLLGGNITVKSEKGKGSTFILNIPYKTS